ncbi:hypothetical protein [Ruminococcus flavefaciens]|uniref:hypothetical protein n=2 Tax=Ruminococcus TaxID=1263 RepID=UPI0013D96A2B|nr:hypothetical protein [Ruminococcus flavefaciens]
MNRHNNFFRQTHIVLIIVFSLLFFTSCNSKSDSSRYYNFENPNAITGIYMNEIKGTKEAFEQLDDKEKGDLRKYLDEWHTLIDRTADHKRKVMEEKDAYINYFTQNIDSIFNKYSDSEEKQKVLSDFYQLITFDAKFTVKGFKCNFKVNINDESKSEYTYIYDDNYEQYLFDVSTYVNELEKHYFS